ncbi:unnamed protein product [Echinostoma caproni]|uniref:ML domain-containing protein n=1 Tax=Echinostoma caproni TaxID=27848 RepID=A0A183AH62_9TREM|nr:unnamed protein product [Echinostoma caproni]
MQASLVVALACLACITSGFRLRGNRYIDCGSKLAEIVDVTVTPCDTLPCPLYRGENATITVQFKPREFACHSGHHDQRIDTGKAVVHGLVAGIPVPFPIEKDDMCSFTQPSCPLAANNLATYTYQLPVLQAYPKMRVTVKWELQDASKKDIICANIPVQIEDRK